MKVPQNRPEIVQGRLKDQEKKQVIQISFYIVLSASLLKLQWRDCFCAFSEIRVVCWFESIDLFYPQIWNNFNSI